MRRGRKSEVLTNEEITVIAENYTSIFKFQTSKYNKSEIQKLQLERKKMLRENRNKIKEERANVLFELEEVQMNWIRWRLKQNVIHQTNQTNLMK